MSSLFSRMLTKVFHTPVTATIRSRPWSRSVHRKLPPGRGILSLEALESREVFSIAPLPGGLNPIPTNHMLVNQSGYLTGPQAGQPLDIALSFLAAHAIDLGVTPADVANPIVTSQYTDQDTGLTHIYLRQQVNGLQVTFADLSITVTSQGQVLTAGGSFISGLQDRIGSGSIVPSLSATQAITNAALSLGLTATKTPTVLSSNTTPDRSKIISAPGISLDNIPIHLHYVPTTDGNAVLAWDMILRTPDGDHWYDVSVDAASGQVMALVDWVDHASYNAVPLPNESPGDGGFAVLTNPADTTASPFGWHDTNGAAGAEFTDTRGNNVDAHLDLNDNDVADADESGVARPDGGAGLDFSGFGFNAAQSPNTAGNEAIAQVNLFVMSNILHDIHYHYGFTEAAGNFQTNNYGNGGTGSDALEADGQDGGGVDNANFATPPDGSAPRMQMYVFDLTNPNRDGDLDNGVIIHEYGHGVSNRLTGGPSNSNALNALQSGAMGEGWSDFYALMFTQRATDTQNMGFPIGTYVLGNTAGIRTYPYSYDMTIDPHTFNDFNDISNEVHDAGETWCSTLWDMNWLLINKYGYDSDLYTGWTAAAGPGHAGNKLAMRLVTEAMKLQPANPSFIEARDAILAADVALNGGADTTEIWAAFTRRGLGMGASTTDSDSPVVITTLTAAVTDVTSSTVDGTYGVGATILIDVTFDHRVDVTGIPTLALNSGGTATYTGGTGTTTLTFSYTVAVGENSLDLDYTSTTALAGTIATANSVNAANLTLPTPGAAGSLGFNKDIVIDTPAAITNVTSSNPDGAYSAGAVISIQVIFSEIVTVTGTPTLALNSGGTATYTSGSGTNTLTFTYTVAAGDNSDDLNYVNRSSLALNGGTIKIPSGANAVILLPLPGSTGSLGMNKDIVIDNVPPKVTAVTSSNPDGSYTVGAVISIQVIFSEIVTVTGTPTLALNSGGTATYTSGSGTNTLTFTYTVAAGQNSDDLDYVNPASLSLNGGSIKDLAGSKAVLTLTAPGEAGSLGEAKNIRIDTIAPTVPSVTSSTADGSYTVGAVISIQVIFSEIVTVTGTPTLALNSGGTATYASGSGTNTLTFTYTVAAGENSDDLDYLNPTSLALNGGSIKDAVNLDAVLRLAAPGAAGSLGKAKNIEIDTIGPTVTSATSSEANGLYGVGSVVSIQMNLSEAVTVAGTPLLALNSGGLAIYSDGSGTNTLTFTYTVAAGQNSDDLDYLNTTSLSLSSGSLRDAAGNDAVLTLAVPGEVGSLGTAKDLVIDSAGPTATISAPSATQSATRPVTFEITYSDPNFDTSTLTAADVLLTATGTAHGVASVDSGTGATRTVTISQITGDGTLGISLAAKTASDKAGNKASFSDPSSVFTVINTQPALFAMGNADGSVRIVEAASGRALVANFRPLDTASSQYKATVAVALGDLDGDGTLELFVAAQKRAGTAGLDPSKAGKVFVYNIEALEKSGNAAPIDTFTPFDSPFGGATNPDGSRTYQTGFELATGDVNGDGILDLVAASRGDVGQISVMSGVGTGTDHARLGNIVTPFGTNYRGKVTVAAGDFIAETGTKQDEIAAARGSTDSTDPTQLGTSTRVAMFDLSGNRLNPVALSGAISADGIPSKIEGAAGEVIDRNAFVAAVHSSNGSDLLLFAARDFVSNPLDPQVRVAVYSVSTNGFANLGGSYLVGHRVGSYAIAPSDIGGDGSDVLALAVDGPSAGVPYFAPLTGAGLGGIDASVLAGGVRLASN